MAEKSTAGVPVDTPTYAYIRSDQLQKALTAPFLCAVTSQPKPGYTRVTIDTAGVRVDAPTQQQALAAMSEIVELAGSRIPPDLTRTLLAFIGARGVALPAQPKENDRG